MQMKLRNLCFSSLIIVASLLLACGKNQSASSYNGESKPSPTHIVSQSLSSDNGDQSVSSENTVKEPTFMAGSEAIVIEGKIAEVMETWPPQMIVNTNDGRYQVALLAETKIGQNGRGVNAGTLQPGLKVRIEGKHTSSNQLAMTAHVIEIR
jgi:hypothetical protein